MNASGQQFGIQKVSYSRLAMPALGICLAFVPALSSGDVVYLKNGQQQAGVILQGGPGQAQVTIKTTGGEIAIPQERIARIEQEPPAKSYARLADAFLESGQLGVALENYRRAAELAPDDQEIRSKLQRAEASQSQAADVAKQAEDVRVEQVIARSRELAQERKFDEALAALKGIEPDAQSPLRGAYEKALANLYYLWGVDRADRQDVGGATEKLQTALRLNPQLEQARQALVGVFQGDPTKLRETAEYYSGSSEPADQIKAADAYYKLREYDKALPIYLKYVSDPQLASEIMLERIKFIYSWMHEQYARAGDYRKALETYQQLLQFAPDADPTPLARYEYMIRRSNTDMNDPAARLELAKFAEESGLITTAREEYANILTMDPDNAGALEALKKYATSELQDAQDFFNQQQYMLAQSKAQEVIRNYTRFEDVVRAAQELYTKAQVEQQKVAVNKQKQAVALALRGDDYYNQAMSYYSSYVSTNINRSNLVFFPREEAAKFFRQAIYAYQLALSMDPSLGDPTSYNLYFKIADAQSKLARIGNRIAPRLPRRDMDRIQRGQNTQGAR